MMLTNLPKVEARNIIAFVVTMFVLSGHGVLLWVAIPTGNKDIYSNMTSLITGGWLTILAFYFGDSKKQPEDKADVAINSAGDVTVSPEKSKQ